MIETEELESIIDKSGIIKEFAPLPYSALGYFYSDGDFHLILINKEIRKDERLYRTILAEEIGHYMTTVGDYTPRREMKYSERIDIDKKELLALRWATDFLIPTELFLKAIKDRLVGTIEEMLDYFYVTEEFLLHKLRFMAKKKMKWEVDDKRSLVLSCLPSLYVYEEI